MSAKVHSTFFTVNWLLGMAGAFTSCGIFALIAFNRGSTSVGIILLSVATAIVVIASRARFPKEEDIVSGSAARVNVVGGPILYFCVLKLNGKWCWFCVGPASKDAFERIFAIDV